MHSPGRSLPYESPNGFPNVVTRELLNPDIDIHNILLWCIQELSSQFILNICFTLKMKSHNKFFELWKDYKAQQGEDTILQIIDVKNKEL